MKLKILFFILALSSSFNAFSVDAFPADVNAFIERRDACDHFRGEEAYDEERRDFLQKSSEESCKGTDKELAKLKLKYKKYKQVQLKLNEYEVNIEV